MSPHDSIDALVPKEMAEKAEAVGVAKAALRWDATAVLAVLAGAFIGLGANFSTIALTGASGLPFGVARVLAGLTFSLGLVLVVVGGAELFTGNNLVVMAWVGKKVSTRSLLRNWGLVYAGNFVGATATAALVFLSGQYLMANGAVGATALKLAATKVELPFLRALLLGVLCNALVCLAVWLSYSARSTVDRVVAVVGPVTAFVAAGFEHSVANMYALPLALFIKAFAGPEFWSATGQSPEAFAALTWQGFLVDNLVPVTLGNLLGGAGLVGLTYWFVYLRRR
jgi:formate transporter